MTVAYNPPQIQGLTGLTAALASGTQSTRYQSPTEELHTAGHGMNIKVIPANGGTIISIRNENTMLNHNHLYIVPEDQDLAIEIGKIITLHYLKS